jgi:hypothetical protein
MTDYRRYAIYYTPEPNSDLARLGTHWMGWDADLGAPAKHLSIEGLGESLSALTERPRRYGFHATLKAPFFLHPERSPLSLHHAVRKFAAGRAPVRMPGLTLSDKHGFLALRPVGETLRLSELEEHLVRRLDDFRAPLSDGEVAKWNNHRLTDKQRAAVADWGYPFVFEDFSFHMTLTGPRPSDRLAKLQRLLVPILEPNFPRPFELRSLSLCGEGPDGFFRVIHRYAMAEVEDTLATIPRTESGEPITPAPKLPLG